MATAIFVLAFVLVGTAVVLFAMRAGGRPLFDPSRRSGRRAIALLAAVAAVLFGIAIPIAVGIDGADQAQAGSVSLTAAEEAGREKFSKACQQCHTLAGSNASGRVGPNLDVLRPPKELTLDAIAKGRARGRGQMPALLFTGRDADDVASYVAKVAGRD